MEYYVPPPPPPPPPRAFSHYLFVDIAIWQLWTIFGNVFLRVLWLEQAALYILKRRFANTGRDVFSAREHVSFSAIHNFISIFSDDFTFKFGMQPKWKMTKLPALTLPFRFSSLNATLLVNRKRKAFHTKKVFLVFWTQCS